MRVARGDEGELPMRGGQVPARGGQQAANLSPAFVEYTNAESHVGILTLTLILGEGKTLLECANYLVCVLPNRKPPPPLRHIMFSFC